jgi:hypothetical protein
MSTISGAADRSFIRGVIRKRTPADQNLPDPDPFKGGIEQRTVYESDAIVAIADGLITHFGPADRIRPQLPPGTEIKDYGRDALTVSCLICPTIRLR